MFERLQGGAASGACRIWIFVIPGWVCGQVTLAGSHLVKAAGDELIMAHEEVRGEAGRVGVVVWGREIFSPSVRELQLRPSSEGRVCSGV